MQNVRYGQLFRYIHFSLIIFGITSYLTGEIADEYEPYGFWIHSILGFAVCFALLFRLKTGFSDIKELSFTNWFNQFRDYKQTVIEDIKLLFKFNLPDRDIHAGIAGVVQAFGLFLFAWMSVTGVLLFIVKYDVINMNQDLIEELHELGEYLIAVFLLIHIGAVISHFLKGDNLLIRINPFVKDKE